MPDGQGDSLRARVAGHVDDQHREDHKALIRHHHHEEAAMLRSARRNLYRHDENRAEAEARHQQAIKRLDRQQEHEAAALHRQQARFGSRLMGMTRKGRLEQAQAREQLAERFDNLRMKEHRTLEALKERQDLARQAQRIQEARHIKLFRAANADDRLKHQHHHDQTRAWKIDQQVRALTPARPVQQQKLLLYMKGDTERSRTERTPKQQLAIKRDFDEARARTMRVDFQLSRGGRTLKR